MKAPCSQRARVEILAQSQGLGILTGNGAQKHFMSWHGQVTKHLWTCPYGSEHKVTLRNWQLGQGQGNI